MFDVRQKQPLFEKSGAKTLVILKPGVSNVVGPDKKSLFASCSYEKEVLALSNDLGAMITVKRGLWPR